MGNPFSIGTTDVSGAISSLIDSQGQNVFDNPHPIEKLAPVSVLYHSMAKRVNILRDKLGNWAQV